MRPILFLALLLAAGLPGGAAAQAPLFLVNPSTEVQSVDFVFTDGETFERDFLRSQIAMTERGMLAGLRERLAFLPLISEPGRHPFDPVELQKDLIRLRRLYAESGFLDHDVQYEVTLDTLSNTVDVRFVIDEGRPITLSELVAESASMEAVDAALPRELTAEWTDFEQGLREENLERRAGPAQVRSLRTRTEGWLRNRGYPSPTVSSERLVDSVAAQATVRLQVDPGPRRRVGDVRIEGNEVISDPVLRREFPLSTGDWFSANRLSEGERELYGLDMVRWADASIVDADGSPDGPMAVRVQVEEGPPRLVSGRLGYATSAGITGQASWSHRNFMGGARVLTFAAEARTGFLAAEETFERRYGLSATLRQPYLWSRRVSGFLTPFFEYRDTPIDEAIRNGIDATVVYELGGINTVSVQYGIAAREVLEFRFGTLTDSGLDFLQLQALLDDSVGSVIRESRLNTSATWGRLDDRLSPRSGFALRVGLEGAGPSALSEVEYGKVTASVSGFQPLGGDVHGRLRLFGGRVYPFGKSVPGEGESAIIRFLELRDALLTAGGTGDVRGWATGLLGPKTPDARLVDTGDSLVVRSDRFIPIGGFARAGFSAEVAVQLPGRARGASAFFFLDGARVWTADDRYGIEDPFDEERFFFGTGAGLEFSTGVGPVRIAVGYKLNPSPVDLRSPMQVLRAAEEGVPLSQVPTESIRRFQLHVDLGSPF